MAITHSPVSPLPRACSRDRRTAAERAPQIPVTVWYLLGGNPRTRTARVSVGVGGWTQDAANALARLLDVPASEITVTGELVT